MISFHLEILIYLKFWNRRKAMREALYLRYSKIFATSFDLAADLCLYLRHIFLVLFYYKLVFNYLGWELWVLLIEKA